MAFAMINGSLSFLKADWLFAILSAAAVAEHQEAMSLINRDKVGYFYKVVNYAFVSKCTKEKTKERLKSFKESFKLLSCVSVVFCFFC